MEYRKDRLKCANLLPKYTGHDLKTTRARHDGEAIKIAVMELPEVVELKKEFDIGNIDVSEINDGKADLTSSEVLVVVVDLKTLKIERVLVVPFKIYRGFTDRYQNATYAYIALQRSKGTTGYAIKLSHLKPINHDTEVDHKTTVPMNTPAALEALKKEGKIE